MPHSLRKPAYLTTFALVLATTAGRTDAATFVVNSTAITDDGNCATTPNGCTLPEAINAANANAGLDEITFDPAVFPPGGVATITVSTALPALTDPKGATLDGTGADVTIDGDPLAGTQIGIHFHTTAGINLFNATVRNLRILNFPGDGIRICAGDPATCDSDLSDITVDGVTSSNHGGEGLRVDADSLEQTTVARSTFENNGGGGVTINGAQTNEDALITDCSALANDDSGFVVTSVVNTIGTTVTGSLSKGNGLHGIFIASNGNVSNTELTNNAAEGNVLVGMGINAFSDVLNTTISSNSSNGNMRAGFEVIAFFDTNIGVSVVNNTAQMNETDGITLAAGATLSNLTVSSNLVTENMEDGIHVGGTGTNQRVNGNIICGNTVGMRLFGAMTAVNAEANWWGDATGPTHPDNSPGTGDPVADDENGGEGAADFVPFITTVTASADPDPTSIGNSTTVNFQFSDAAATVSLGEGPGDLNAIPPFTITTTNGSLTSSTGTANTVSEFINNPNGFLKLTLNPAQAVNSNISLTGPCGLAAALVVETIQADLAVDKTDQNDPVETGAAATYVITVTNNGPDDAPNVTVQDTLPGGVVFGSATPSQGTCSEAGGVVTCDLGTLASGAAATITIVVSTDEEATLTNLAEASSDALDLDPANNLDAEDTTVIQAEEQCGAGLCGYGTFGMMPILLLGLGAMKRRGRRLVRL